MRANSLGRNRKQFTIFYVTISWPDQATALWVDVEDESRAARANTWVHPSSENTRQRSNAELRRGTNWKSGSKPQRHNGSLGVLSNATKLEDRNLVARSSTAISPTIWGSGVCDNYRNQNYQFESHSPNKWKTARNHRRIWSVIQRATHYLL